MNEPTFNLRAPSLPETQTMPPRQADGETVPSSADLPRPFGRYTLQRRQGKGGMGVVYLAHDAMLGRQVALKVPHAEVIASSQALERFHREARAAAQLDHPGICRVLDVGAFEGQPYITMAYVEGRPLADLIESFVGQPRRTAALLRQVALAVEEAHSRGIVHRDLKPANVMITARGDPVIMDFGLARVASGAEASETSPGLIMGTPAYMSPEQANGDTAAVGPPADIYALGVLLYELLTGRVPFQGGLMDLLMQVATSPPTPPSRHRPDVDPTLEAVCLKAMEKQPASRFASAGVLALVLEDYLEGRVSSELALAPASPEQAAFEAVLRDLRALGWEAGWAKARGWLPGADALGAGRDALLAWGEGAGGSEKEVRERFPDVPQVAALAAWVQVGHVLAALRHSLFDHALVLAEQLMDVPRPGDPALAGQLAYLRGLALARLGRWDESLHWVHEALERLGRDHFLTGGVLDALGRVHAGKCHFHAACEFYREAIACKGHHGDDEGVLASHEALGRVYIDWHLLDQAEETLNAGLRLAQKRRDAVGEARLIHHLGRVVLHRGEKSLGAGRKASAAKRFRQATDYFDWAARAFACHGLAEEEGLARARLGVLAMLGGDLDRAEEQLTQAEALVRPGGSAEALADVFRARGRLRLAQGRHDDALLLLRHALATYDGLGKHLEATRTQLELARVLAGSQVPQRMVVRAYQDAASRAEACRTDELVELIDQELESIDEEAYWRHAFERTRSTAAPLFTGSLHRGSSEAVSILCLELADFEAFCQGAEPEAVLRTLNHLLVDFEGVIQRYRGHITSYLGSGLVALVREAGHAERAVQAALDLRAAVAEFNQPRGILGLPMLPARVSVASGPVFLGNIGTYRYMCFTGVGPVPNLACSIARRADPTAPCISQETYDQVRDRFLYRPEGARQIEVPGVGTVRVWDVVGRNRAAGKGPSSGRVATRGGATFPGRDGR